MQPKNTFSTVSSLLFHLHLIIYHLYFVRNQKRNWSREFLFTFWFIFLRWLTLREPLSFFLMFTIFIQVERNYLNIFMGAVDKEIHFHLTMKLFHIFSWHLICSLIINISSPTMLLEPLFVFTNSARQAINFEFINSELLVPMNYEFLISANLYNTIRLCWLRTLQSIKILIQFLLFKYSQLYFNFNNCDRLKNTLLILLVHSIESGIYSYKKSIEIF